MSLTNYSRTYFKTEDAFRQKCKEFNADLSTVECACGESRGAIVRNNDGTISHYLILCASCYENAANDQKGE